MSKYRAFELEDLQADTGQRRRPASAGRRPVRGSAGPHAGDAETRRPHRSDPMSEEQGASPDVHAHMYLLSRRAASFRCQAVAAMDATSMDAPR